MRHTVLSKGNIRLFLLLISLIVVGVLSAGCPEDQATSDGAPDSSESEQSDAADDHGDEHGDEEESDEEPATDDDVPDAPVEESDQSTASQIYDQVELGMSRDEVEEIAGRSPTMTNEIETESLGKVENLIYQSGPSDQPDVVTISLQDGKVKTSVLGEWNGDQINTKIKGVGI